jgi:hypothetical protein
MSLPTLKEFKVEREMKLKSDLASHLRENRFKLVEGGSSDLFMIESTVDLAAAILKTAGWDSTYDVSRSRLTIFAKRS